MANGNGKASKKTAKDYNESKTKWEKYDGFGHGKIQWENTAICMDLICDCGHVGHVDLNFTFNMKCPNCNRVFSCNPYIELIELEEEPDDHIALADGQSHLL